MIMSDPNHSKNFVGKTRELSTFRNGLNRFKKSLAKAQSTSNNALSGNKMNFEESNLN